MIFISGVHGVGKSFFCDKVRDQVGMKSFSASALITERKKAGFPASKLIPDIDENQQYLLDAVEELKASEQEFLLDGHFCLLDGSGKITRIPENTFTSLHPDAIILLTEDPAIIAERRRSRDGITAAIEDIRAFQDEEILYAQEIADLLGVPIRISKGNHDIDSTISFVAERRNKP